MTNPIKHESDQLNMDGAWARLQDSIAQEPVNPVWAAWGQQSTTNNDPLINAASTAGTAGGRTAMTQITGQADSTSEGKKTGRRTRRPQMNRRRKWAATAASVAIFAAILATPVGSTAMAAILNQFRMQEPTVVNESDLRNIFNQITEGELSVKLSVNSERSRVRLEPLMERYLLMICRKRWGTAQSAGKALTKSSLLGLVLPWR